jgi:DNA-binding protein Fis
MNKDLTETDNLRQSAISVLPEKIVRLKLAETPDRDRIQRVVDLADALLSEAETLARDKAFTEEATRLKPLDILGGISFYDEVVRFETNLIQMALRETGGNRTKAARLLGIKATTLNSKIRNFGLDVSSASHSAKRKRGEGLTEVELTVLRLLHRSEQDRRAVYDKGPLRFCIDGTEFLRCHISKGLFTSLRVPVDSEYLEVFGDDDEGEFLLGVFAFPETDMGNECEGKQKATSYEIGNSVELSVCAFRENTSAMEYLLEARYRKTTDRQHRS